MILYFQSCILNYGDSWNYPRTVYFTPLWPYIFSFSDDSYNLSRTVYFTLWRPFLFIRYFFKKWNRIISASDRIYYADDRIFSVQNRIFYQDRIHWTRILTVHTDREELITFIIFLFMASVSLDPLSPSTNQIAV